MKSTKLSIVIATKNEEKTIHDCLKSVGWADEIIIVDDFSTDRTIEIAKRFKAKIFFNRWQGFSEQKNYGFEKTSRDWILFIDADERVTPELKEEILKIVNSSETIFSAYNIPRLNNILGKDLYYGGWYPDYQKRLVKREKFKGWVGKLHETMVTQGGIGKLTSNIYHLTHRGITWMLNKSIIYTEYEAEERFNNQHPQMVWWRFFRPPVQEFFFRLIIKCGWRDGPIGLIEAIYQAFNQFIIYARLWEMQRLKKETHEF